MKVVGTNPLAVSTGTLGTTIGVDARIGSLQSRAAVTLKDRARASGVVVSGGAVAVGAGAGADGGISSNATLANDLLSLTVSFPPAGAPIWLEPTQQQTIAPGSFGSVNLKTSSVLFLRSGDYYFQSLTVEPKAQLAIDANAGPVRLYVKSGLIFRGNAAGLNATAPQLILVYMGTEDPPIQWTA